MPSRSIKSLRRKLPKTELSIPYAAELISDVLNERGFVGFALEWEGLSSTINEYDTSKNSVLLSTIYAWLGSTNVKNGPADSLLASRTWEDFKQTNPKKYSIQFPASGVPSTSRVFDQLTDGAFPSPTLEAAKELLKYIVHFTEHFLRKKWCISNLLVVQGFTLWHELIALIASTLGFVPLLEIFDVLFGQAP